jgi:hypothetical protein
MSRERGRRDRRRSAVGVKAEGDRPFSQLVAPVPGELRELVEEEV